jgi:membrane protease YdiL (CAAX protease family)
MAPVPRYRELAALAFAMIFFPSVMAWIYFVALTPGAGGMNPATQAAYTLGKIVQFSFPLVYLLIVDRGSLRAAAPNFAGLRLGLAFGLAVAAAMLVLYFGILRETLLGIGLAVRVRAKLEEFGAATPARFLAFAAFISVAHSLLEEYYWRWFVFRRLRLLTPAAPAIAISSLAFMAHHVIVLDAYLPDHFLSAVVPFSLAVAVGGAVWAWLYARTGSLYAAWVSHLLVDVAVMVVGYDLVFV